MGFKLVLNTWYLYTTKPVCFIKNNAERHEETWCHLCTSHLGMWSAFRRVCYDRQVINKDLGKGHM